MFEKTLSSNEENSQISFLDHKMKEILSKINQMKVIISNNNEDPYNESFSVNIDQIIKSIEHISTVSSNNFHFLDDFQESINIIDLAIDCYINSLKSITNPQENPEKIQSIKNDIIIFSQSLTVFSTNFLEIMQTTTTINQLKDPNEREEEQQKILNTRLGLESTLFNLSVKFQKIDEFPFFKSKFVGVYRCYNTLNSISEPISAIQSFCGSGKTSIIPLILMSRSLKENFTSPFVILTQPTPKHVENEEIFFNSLISKYVTVVTDSEKFIEIFNEFEKSQKNPEKLVFAILTPHLLLQLLFSLRESKLFYQSTRIIIDEIHQRTFHLDVLLAKIANVDLKIQLNIVLMSATIYPKILNPFEGKVTVTSLIKSSQYEIVEKPPIIEHFIDKINDEVVRDEAIKVIQEMAKINSTIEKGHILCFLNLVKVCNNVNKSVVSLLNSNEETEERRKIVFLRTTLKSKETIESFYKRLQKEYEINEELRKASSDNYKYDFFYVIPLVFSGVAEDAISELVLNEFPGELKKITKLICSTPLSESFNYEGLSVVIDSGLAKQPVFDAKTGLTMMVEVQASKEAMFQRKGRLGRSMKGLYIPIYQNKDRPDIQIPPIQRLDLTTNILLMKNINIDFEELKNLPDEPNNKNVDFAFENLKKMKAIDEENSKITQLGHEMLAFPFISIYYADAAIQMKEKFSNDDKNNVYFIGIYVATIISMDSLLVTEDMSVNLSKCFDEYSDIVTLFKAINSIITIKEANKSIKSIVESCGFSFSIFVQLIENLKKVATVTHPEMKLKDVVVQINEFLKKKGITIHEMIDLFINEIKLIDRNWSNVHHIKFNKVKDAGVLNKSPTLLFEGSKKLRFKKQRTSMTEVSIAKRPGWNGITIPTDCYCFNISRNKQFNKNNGRLIHRISKDSKIAIKSIEVDNFALNPWFIVLLNCYFKDELLKVTRFPKDESTTKDENDDVDDVIDDNDKSNFSYDCDQVFHLSNVGGRVFVSFVSLADYDQSIIKNGIKACMKVLPYTPNAILVYRKDVDSIAEIRLIGTEIFDIRCANEFCGGYLNKKRIEYCAENIDKMKTFDPTIRICALFVKESCKLGEYVQKNLFFVDNESERNPISIYVNKEIKIFNEKMVNLKQSKIKNSLEMSDDIKEEFNLFEFPPSFIHPALLLHQKSLECILNWFTNHCDYAHVIKVIGHRILMKSAEIKQLQIHIKDEGNQIKEQMNLNYEAIPVPLKIYSRSYVSIKENPLWKYDEHFKAIVTTKDEAVNVKEFIQKVQSEIDKIEFTKTKTKPDSSSVSDQLCGNVLGCILVCDDPENPNLSNSPLTLYFQDGSYYTSRICRDCVLDSIQNAINPYINERGFIDQKVVEFIRNKPSQISVFASKSYNNGEEYWPLIPIGQLISLLINEDEQLSKAISKWLQIVVEFGFRCEMGWFFTFCPRHPQQIIAKNGSGANVKCKFHRCNLVYCNLCDDWHPSSLYCAGMQMSKNLKRCPKCKRLITKNGGCNHISCPCGCHWCYVCREGFLTSDMCYRHLRQTHGGIF